MEPSDRIAGVVDDPTFPYRVAFGLTIFGVLAVVDVVRNPKDPRRLKEYAFLFGVTGAVMLYGLAHDAITFSLSPEYYRIIKGLRAKSFFPAAANLALAASWTAGLAIGLAFLVANNPSRRRAQLRYTRLARHLSWVIVASPSCAACLALVSLIAPTWSLHALGLSVSAVQDPGAVTTVWAIHIGTYLGAALGLIAGVISVSVERTTQKGPKLPNGAT